MTKVSLRVYNREIEGMIEGSQLDEAIAHCQHILKTYPMHVETYRLLGKAFLEARRYGDAADIFQRVLMAVPDDFVSHVGMSIIRDDEGKLDDSIWHMERAFEVQPSNSAIQGELRRLYGRRDGVEPPKIRLSRDALANMYSQGELFNQAIAEIRSVLADDPNRPDLQVMLARANYRAGQKVEAAEMAAVLLKKYPYCLDALRVLVDVLPGTTGGDNLQVYRHRLGMLDPYSLFTTGSVFASDQAGEASVNLERLEYRAGMSPASAQPDWASSLGIKLATEKNAAAAPTWNEQPANADQPAQVSIEPAAGETTPQGDSVPEWMRTAGWQAASGEDLPAPAPMDEEAPAEALAEAEIPDWLKSMAPAQVTEQPEQTTETSVEAQPTTENDIPDWLKTMAPTQAAMTETPPTSPELMDIPTQMNEPAPKDEANIPDWLNSQAPADEEKVNTPPSEPEPMDIPTQTNETVQAELPTTLPEAIPAAEGDVPDWLRSLAPEGTDAAIPGQGEPVATASMPADEVKPIEQGDLPDWLRSIAPAAGVASDINEPAAPVAQPAEETTFPDLLDQTPSGQKGEPELGDTQPTPMILSGSQAKSKAVEPVISDWLASQPEEKLTPESVELEQIAETPVPVEPVAREPVAPPSRINLSDSQPFQPTGEVKPLGIGDDAMGWLESLAAKQGANPEELLTKPQERSEEMPDWLQPGADTLPKAEPPITQRTPAETLPLEMPAMLSEFGSNTTAPPAEVNISQPEMHPVVEPVAEPENVPAEAPKSEEPSAQPVTIEDDTMAWLEGLAAKQGANAEELLTNAEDRNDSVPEWIENARKDESPAAAEPVNQSLPGEDNSTIAKWLKAKDVAEYVNERTAVEPVPEAVQPAEDLPDWLRDPDKTTAPQAAQADVDMPDWLHEESEFTSAEQVQPDQVAASELESLPAEAMPAWMEEPEEAAAIPEKTAPDEWVPIEKQPTTTDASVMPAEFSLEETVPTAAKVLPEAISLDETVPTAAVKSAGALAAVPMNNKDSEVLSAAQAALEKNSLSEAMKEYGKLIKRNRLLDEVIHDLREAIYRYPVDVIIWQTLGDAYMRANRLQDALDAYTKAEELLR